MIPKELREFISQQPRKDAPRTKALLAQEPDEDDEVETPAATIKYSIYPIDDVDGEMQKKQMRMKLENIKVNVDYFQAPENEEYAEDKEQPWKKRRLRELADRMNGAGWEDGDSRST